MDEAARLVSPCGVDCGDCPAYKSKDDPAIMQHLLSLGFKKETLPCPGCRPLKGKCPVIGGNCDTYACFEKKKIAFCYECVEFPCGRFLPAVDKAAAAVQNLKVFNLCCIQKHGLKQWLKSAADNKKRYYQGKLIYGKGPQL